jgi:glycosyltransferase involved in cell wall biosynthesis
MSVRRLHVAICNERLLPRFGVDRVLLVLGGGLVREGHHVSFVCQRCDRQSVEAISHDVVELSELGLYQLHVAEAAATHWLLKHWGQSPETKPDIVVTGGWPFFKVGEVCSQLGIPSVFIDAGAVPHDGMSDGVVSLQCELRRVRARALPNFAAVLPISDFIRDSQTLPDRGTAAGVQTVRLGANHLDTPMFGTPVEGADDGAVLAEVKDLAASGRRLVLLLGRFEAEGYKNSPAAYEVFAKILEREPKAKLLVLAKREQLVPPDTVKHAVFPLSFVSDSTLSAIMQHCTLGLSMSRWEGFNLPLAEMQWLGRPVIAFNVAAHPEVIADPWLLCGSIEEMAKKAGSLLRQGLPPHLRSAHRFEQFRERFRWEDVIARYVDLLEDLAVRPVARAVDRASTRRTLLVDCTCASIDPANPGVIRVSRRLGRVLQQNPAFLPFFVRWDLELGTYRTLTPSETATLATYGGPEDELSSLFSAAGQGVWAVENIVNALETAAPPVLFLPEVVLDGRFPERIAWARARNMSIAALLFDLIPVTHSQYCSPSVVSRFPEYLEGVAATDAIWAISQSSMRELEFYLRQHNLPRPPSLEAIWLPAQFATRPRVTKSELSPDRAEIIALCLGSIEPRKNHRNLVEAFQRLLRRRSDLPLRLVIVGHRFEGSEALADWLTAVTKENKKITWSGLISDEELAALFETASFTVYPSLVEGYGLPIVESLWLGRPCLCHSRGVMAELAAEGGCLTTDMADVAAIEQALERLACDVELRQRLTHEAIHRDLRDWDAYGAEIGRRLYDIIDRTRLKLMDRTRRNVSLTGRVGIQSVSPRDSEAEVFYSKIKKEAALLRDLPDHFVRVLDVPVMEAFR